MNSSLVKFVQQSNLIEGIDRYPTIQEVNAHERFLMIDRPQIEDLVNFVAVAQPGAQLRDRPEVHGVRVGNHIAPPSGPEIRRDLRDILVNIDGVSPYEQHCRYLTLHPFTDGNGRSSRVLWLWRMNGHAPLGFLHHFYYQALDASDGRN